MPTIGVTGQIALFGRDAGGHAGDQITAQIGGSRAAGMSSLPVIRLAGSRRPCEPAGARTAPGSGSSGDHVYSHPAWPGQRQGLAGLLAVTR